MFLFSKEFINGFSKKKVENLPQVNAMLLTSLNNIA